VLDWPLPRSVCAVRAFLSLAGYYHRFIKNYGAITTPLMALLKKDTFKRSAKAEEAFQALQHALTTAPILYLPNFDRDFIMECDTSGMGLGTVLHQGGRHVAFFSCQLVGTHLIGPGSPALVAVPMRASVRHHDQSLQLEVPPRQSLNTSGPAPRDNLSTPVG
jgi:hypothetical protein